MVSSYRSVKKAVVVPATPIVARPAHFCHFQRRPCSVGLPRAALDEPVLGSFGMKGIGLGVVDRRQLADHPGQEQVGQLGVARQHRPVQVGAPHPARHGALDRAVLVAHAGLHLAHRPGRRGRSSVTAPWFSNPVSVRQPTVRPIRAPARTSTSPMARGELERTVTQSSKPEPLAALAVGADETLTQDLEPGTDGQDHGTASTARCSGRPALSFEAASAWGRSSPPPIT